MYQTKLCLGVSGDLGMDTEEQIRLFHEIGFEGFFTGYDQKQLTYRRLADELGMVYQSVHAPFVRIAKLWTGEEGASDMQNELLCCINDCADAGVPIMVCHAYIGFAPSAGPTLAGIERFRRVVEEAGKRGVRIAFENTEGEEYLAALMDAFKEYSHVGFCWDTGHELCYNYGKDLTALYGDRLFCTHLNDNLGIRDYEGRITWHDDLHLLPFDGICDWQDVTERLNRHGYDDILTFELNKTCSTNRHDKDSYRHMDAVEYIAQAYVRACRVAALKSRGKSGK